MLLTLKDDEQKSSRPVNPCQWASKSFEFSAANLTVIESKKRELGSKLIEHALQALRAMDLCSIFYGSAVWGSYLRGYSMFSALVQLQKAGVRLAAVLNLELR